MSCTGGGERKFDVVDLMYANSIEISIGNMLHGASYVRIDRIYLDSDLFIYCPP